MVKEYNLQNRVEERVVMLEAWLDINSTMEYYKCGDFPFNFGFVNLNEAPDAKGVSDLINEWLDHIPQSKIPNWVLGNHDRKRLGTRYIRFQIRSKQYGKGPSINHVDSILDILTPSTIVDHFTKVPVFYCLMKKI